MIGAVVPICNRLANLQLLLASLEEQTTRTFTVVVADDGSTDGTREYVETLASTPNWRNRLTWVGCGPDRGVRTGRARNIGAANIPTNATHILMLDSDLVLQHDAIARLTEACDDHPKTILLGAVEWLPPSDHDDIKTHIRGGRVDTLRTRVPSGTPRRVEGTFVGRELREGLRVDLPNESFPMKPEWALPLNSAWPVDAYWQIGGFDEAMNGYGYQDMEFGARAEKAGLQARYEPALWALHVWHPKPAKAMLENQRNLDFFLRRHGPHEQIEVDVDWSLWWHYHAERRGSVVRWSDDLWAVNANRTQRLRLPDESWVGQLGHAIPVVRDDESAGSVPEAQWSTDPGIDTL